VRSVASLMTAGLVALAASQALAEGVQATERVPSTRARLYDADVVMPRGGGLIAVGGSSLRYLAPGSQRWETIHRQSGDNLYRAEADDSGRLMAAWEKDPFIHAFTLKTKQHVSIPKPPTPPDLSRHQVDQLFFLPNGHDALVFMRGVTKWTETAGQRDSTAAYRFALDGKSKPELLFRRDSAFLVHASRHGAVFVVPQDPRRECNNRRCDPVASIVAYEFSQDGVRQKTLLTQEQAAMDNARLVSGSGAESPVLMLDLGRKDRALLRWRYGDEKADYRPLPPAQGNTLPDDFGRMHLVTQAGEFIELREQGAELQIVRHLPEGGERVTSLPPLKDPARKVHAFGERSNGALWLHWGDFLVLITPGKPPRSYSIEPFLGRFTEWASANVYVRTPETLWVGMEIRAGRDFIRVSFEELEKRAKPWR
jgi:hypothetical protein